MTTQWADKSTAPHCQVDGVATRACERLLLSSSPGMLGSNGPSEDVTRLTLQGAAQFVQDICAIHSRAVVIEPKQSRIGHTGLLSQAIDRPTLFVKDSSKLANDHAGNLAGPTALCQLSHIYEVCFTYNVCRSKVAPRQTGLCALGLKWETATTNLRASIAKTSPGLLSCDTGGRT